MIDVSVIIPTHNRPEKLQNLLNSLLRQTLDHEKIEILVIHNYVADGTERIVIQWSNTHNIRLRYFKKNYNGPAASRDFGARNANGDFIAFIDDDCIASPEWLENALKSFSDDTVGLVQGKTLPRPDQPRRLLEKTVSIESASIFFETCNIMYSKKAFMQVGGFSDDFIDKFYGEDTDLGWKVKNAGFSTVFCSDALVYHEVFQVSYWKWLKEPLFFKNIPYLVKKNPQLRKYMFGYFFLNPDTAMFYLLLSGTFFALTYNTVAGIIISLPYFVQRYQSGTHMQNLAFKILRIIFGLPRGLFTWWALFSGSIRARNILL